jgi:hypothetical protein
MCMKSKRNTFSINQTQDVMSCGIVPGSCCDIKMNSVTRSVTFVTKHSRWIRAWWIRALVLAHGTQFMDGVCGLRKVIQSLMASLLRSIRPRLFGQKLFMAEAIQSLDFLIFTFDTKTFTIVYWFALEALLDCTMIGVPTSDSNQEWNVVKTSASGLILRLKVT